MQQPTIPRAWAYFRPSITRVPCSEEERLFFALNDPQFVWNVGERYALAGQSLPACLPPLFYEVWAFCMGSEPYSARVWENVLIESRPGSHYPQRLLLCREVTVGEIARWLRCSEAVVWRISECRFNVRDRLDEGAYIDRLIFPNGRPDKFDSHYFRSTPSGLLAQQVAYLYGLQEMLALTHFNDPSYQPQLPVDTRRKLKRKSQQYAKLARRCRHVGDLDMANRWDELSARTI